MYFLWAKGGVIFVLGNSRILCFTKDYPFKDCGLESHDMDLKHKFYDFCLDIIKKSCDSTNDFSWNLWFRKIWKFVRQKKCKTFGESTTFHPTINFQQNNINLHLQGQHSDSHQDHTISSDKGSSHAKRIEFHLLKLCYLQHPEREVLECQMQSNNKVSQSKSQSRANLTWDRTLPYLGGNPDLMWTCTKI